MLARSALLNVSIAAILAMPVCATAQRPVTVGVAGGFTETTGTARTYAYETGAHAQFSLERARFL